MYPLRGLSRWYRLVGWFHRFKLDDNIHRSPLENLNNYASLAKYFSYLYIDLFHTIFTSSNSNWPFPESWILVRGLPRIASILLVLVLQIYFIKSLMDRISFWLSMLMKVWIGNTRLRHKINRYLNTERDRKRVCGWDKLNERNYYI